jgi:DNA-binding transcriptional MerR regulator
MKTADTYLVREFARLAGVTARTLHYYDQIGLLSPTLRTEAGHRRYTLDDALRLQQIATLKYMGFSLEEIRDLLDSPNYDVQQSLRMQKAAIDERISQLRQVSRALDHTLRAVEDNAQSLPWEELSTIIKGVNVQPSKESQEWVRSHYTTEQQEWLDTRSASITPEQMAGWQKDWDDLAEEFKARQHLPVEDPEVQALAARYAGLINTFTEGDRGISSALNTMYNDPSKVPTDIMTYGADLHGFMGKAYTYYLQNKK